MAVSLIVPAVPWTHALELSDQRVAVGCPPDSLLFRQEHAALVRAYLALLTAVHH